jgi:hypothetical protein
MWEQPASATPRKQDSPSVTTVRRDDLLRQALHAATLEARDALELDASGTAIVRRLNRHDNRRLAGAAATGLAAAPLAAEICVVHCHAAVEALCLSSYAHDLGEFCLDLPGRSLRDAQPAAEFDGGDALFGLRDEIHGAEPGREPHLGRGEDGAGCERGLAAADVALIQVTRPDIVPKARLQHDAVLPPAAPRAHEALGPSPLRNRFAALVLTPIENHETSLREALLKLDAIARHDHLPQIARRFAGSDGGVKAYDGA